MKCFVCTDQVARFLGTDINPGTKIARFCVDSRAIQPGDLFVALRGVNSDGHNYLSEVESRGAAAAIVSNGFQYKGSIPLIPVNDTLKALQALASEVGRQTKARVIGVTGSVGKTTTKEMIASLLEAKYKVACSPGNYNSQIGLPLTLLNHIRGDEEFLVLEMAMSAAGNIDRLTTIVPPEIAVITQIALVHAAFFESLHEIAREKGRIFANPKTRIGFYPQGVACQTLLEQVGSCLKHSVDLTDDLYPSLPFPGRHLRDDFLLAAAVARECGLTFDEIASRIPSLRLPERRNERVEKGGVTFINDTYNASAPSVIAALRALPKASPTNKRIAVLGEMKELGSFSKECHQSVGEEALKQVDQLLCLGAGCLPIVELWQKHGRAVSYYTDRDSLTQALASFITPGDIVLIKGANSQQLWKVLDDLFTSTVSA